MNFCLKGHLFSRKIAGFTIPNKNTIIVFFEHDITDDVEYIEFNSDDIVGEATPLINNFNFESKTK